MCFCITPVEHNLHYVSHLVIYIPLSFSDVLEKKDSKDIEAVAKAKTLYRSCINESKLLAKLPQLRVMNITLF